MRQSPEFTSFKQLFGSSRQYLSPVFQRLYVWGETHLDDLHEDLTSVADLNAPTFIGAVVLENRPRQSAFLEEMLIIDGQQPSLPT